MVLMVTSVRMAPPLPLIVLLMIHGVSSYEWGVSYSSLHICALKDSTVIMRCSYTYPYGHQIMKVFWTNPLEKDNGEFPDMSEDPEYSQRLQYLGDKRQYCTVRLSHVTLTDSHEYYFRFITDKDKWFGKPGVTLTVTDLQVESPERVTEGDSVRLTCKSSCTLTDRATFIWSRNSQPLTERRDGNNELLLQSVRREDAGRYSCAVHGHTHTSPGVYLHVMYPPRSVSVSISPSGVIVEGDSVTLSCSSDSNPPALNFSWFKGGTIVGSGRIYSISNISSDDSGEYKCKSINEHGEKYSDAVTLNVMYPPRSVSVSISPSGVIVEGDSVTLSCSSDSNPPALNFSWFKGGTIVGSGRIYSISNISSDDSGEYKCKSINEHGEKYSDSVTLYIMYPPKSVSVSISPSGVIVEGDSVTLSCSSDSNPPALNFSWFIGGTIVGSGRIYSISNISSDDSGEYKCKSINEHGEKYSDTVTLNVMYPPRNVSVSISPSGVIVEGDSVTLSCSSDSNPPALNFSWFKGGTLVGSGRIYSISNISYDDSGEYKCNSTNEHGEKYSDAVTLNVMWRWSGCGPGGGMEGQAHVVEEGLEIQAEQEARMEQAGQMTRVAQTAQMTRLVQTTTTAAQAVLKTPTAKQVTTTAVQVVQPESSLDSGQEAEPSLDSGQEAEPSLDSAHGQEPSLDSAHGHELSRDSAHGPEHSRDSGQWLEALEDPPRSVSVSISPSGVIVEGDSVTLSCSSDSNPPALNFSWFKGGTIVGSGRIYSISNISSDDSGEYKCKSINEHGEKYSDAVTLKVMYPPRSVSVSISPSGVIVEGDSVTLSCSSDSKPPALNFSWFKEGTFVGSGRIYSISNIRSDDSGEYKCKSINEHGEKYSDAVTLNVMYPPRSVSVSISPSGVIVEGDSVTLSCSSDSNPPALNFSWFKGGTIVGSGRIYSISNISSDYSGEYKCKSINEHGEKYSDNVTLNVMYPPRSVSVSISPSGVIVEGDSVTLSCSSDSNPPALNFSWFKGGTIVGSGRIYSISNISSDDSGEYKCKSINEHGQKYSDAVTLNVMYSPKNVSVSISPSGVIVEGDSVTLSCSSDSNPPALNFSWFKGGTIVGSGRIYRISKISSDDSGEYKCKSINEHGEKYSDAVTLNIMYPPRSVSVSISPSGVIVEGDSVTLSCSSDSNPPALNFSWFKGGTIVGSGRIYSISSIISDDSGEYKCKSINEHGEKYSDDVTLNIMYPPRSVSVSISPSGVIVEGDSVTLSCSSDSNPPALNFSWFKGGTFVGSGRIYSISNISSDDSGEYKCKSINEHGEKYSDAVTLNVMYPPRSVSVSISPSGVIVEGDSVTLSCSSDSNPPALNFSWFKGGTIVGSGRIYSISNISSDDSGEYKCKSTNEHGEKYSDTVTLNIMYPPRSVSVSISPSGVIVEGDSVTLSCSSDSNPPALNFSWFKGGTIVGSGRIYSISNISSDDSGEYKCKSINEHGQKYSDAVTLNVMYSPKNVSVSISPSGVIVEGDSVTLSCSSDSNPPALNFSWFKGGTIVGSGRIYRISKISSDDSGEYKCKSINEHGEKYSDACLAVQHARTSLEGAACGECDKLPLRVLRSWLAVFDEAGQPREPRDSGPVVAEAARRHRSWGSQMDLSAGLGTAEVSSLSSSDNSDILPLRAEAREAASSREVEDPVQRLSDFEESVAMSTEAGDVGQSPPHSPAKEKLVEGSASPPGSSFLPRSAQQVEQVMGKAVLSPLIKSPNPPRSVSVSISPSGVIVEGDSVTLSCSSDSNPPPLNFSWFKGGTIVGSGRIYSISNISSDDSGEYKCKSINDHGEKNSDAVTLNVMYPPRSVSVSISPSSVIVEGDSVTLSCSSDSNPPALSFSWFKGGTIVGSGRIYSISKISSDDSGEYKCKSINEHGEKYSDAVTLNVMWKLGDFENLSTKTSMQVWFPEMGRSVMKSTPRCDQGQLGMGRGRSLLEGRWRGLLDMAHSQHRTF
ncbi:sialoadhesin-like [Pseudorasbora parva]|uniref:sialoadhesin-like n=1 Tax=Pseudorasbora parva TaxID=51549 RepID=UPI00351DC250